MAEYRKIGSIEVLFDTESPRDTMGEIHFGISDEELERHVKCYGITQMSEAITGLQWRLMNMLRKVNQEKSDQCVALSNQPGA